MTLLERILNRHSHLVANRRDFVLGPGVVDPTDVYFGHSNAPFQPPEYVEYLSASNGVYAAATLRANSLAALPPTLFRHSRANRTEVTAGNLRELIDTVNPFWTWERLIRMTELSLCIWGEAFWFLERGQTGKSRPRQIWWGRADRVRIVPDEKKYIQGYLYEPTIGGAPIEFLPGEVIWMPHPNLADEFSGLAPLSAARLAADVATAAMKSNRNIFHNGLQFGGLVSPRNGSTFTPQQAKELSEDLERRFKGVDKSHRWGVMREEVQLQEAGITPHDAEFLGALAWSLEDISRAYHIPLDLLGGRRTYDNFKASLEALYLLAVIPEARFIASELEEKLLPLFPGEADEVVFDTSAVSVLQEAEGAKWQRAREQLEAGVITINEWRQTSGLQAVDWGDEPLLPIGLTPVSRLINPPAPEPTPEIIPASEPEIVPAARAFARKPITRGAPPFGSAEHRRLLQRAEDRATPFERKFDRQLKPLFERQREAILKSLGGRAYRAAPDEPFDRAEWERIFKTALYPLYREIVDFVGQAALDDLDIALDFNLDSAAVEAFLQDATQRFAEQVNETTWQHLKETLAAGVKKGETVKELEERVIGVMAGRIRSSGETIARTEVLRSYTGSQLEGWRQAEVVAGKSWLAALDDRTRSTHIEAHGQTVPLNSRFTVGGATGDGPGLMGTAEEDINCRCTIIAVLGED